MIVKTQYRIPYNDLLDSHRQLVRLVKDLEIQRSKMQEHINFLHETLMQNGVQIWIRPELN